jgi:hypothetical protein
MVVTKKQHKFGSATEESVLPPKTNDKKCIGTMNFISVSPSLSLRIPSPPTRRAEKGHAGAFQTFPLWRWGGEWFRSMPKSTLFFSDYPGERSSLPSCRMQSISGFSPEKDCIGNMPWKIREPSG